jgi:hypothetical protein
MKSSSDKYPQTIVKSNNKTQVRFDIEEVTKEVFGEVCVSYNFSYIEIVGELTRAKIISAIIRTKYSEDDEIALINNNFISPSSSEYDEYQSFRTHSKEVTTLAGYPKVI